MDPKDGRGCLPDVSFGITMKPVVRYCQCYEKHECDQEHNSVALATMPFSNFVLSVVVEGFSQSRIHRIVEDV